ncbi:hypothetical protein SAMN05428954_7278 [Streptomyces sp. 2112.3]|nr:hypothetical protein SAMN05428954_7278 [Streptomyces sp. 2112.3]
MCVLLRPGSGAAPAARVRRSDRAHRHYCPSQPRQPQAVPGNRAPLRPLLRRPARRPQRITQRPARGLPRRRLAGTPAAPGQPLHRQVHRALPGRPAPGCHRPLVEPPVEGGLADQPPRRPHTRRRRPQPPPRARIPRHPRLDRAMALHPVQRLPAPPPRAAAPARTTRHHRRQRPHRTAPPRHPAGLIRHRPGPRPLLRRPARTSRRTQDREPPRLPARDMARRQTPTGRQRHTPPQPRQSTQHR